MATAAAPFSRHVLHVSELLMVIQLHVLTARHCALIIVTILYRLFSPGFIYSSCSCLERSKQRSQILNTDSFSSYCSRLEEMTENDLKQELEQIFQLLVDKPKTPVCIRAPSQHPLNQLTGLWPKMSQTRLLPLLLCVLFNIPPV